MIHAAIIPGFLSIFPPDTLITAHKMIYKTMPDPIPIFCLFVIRNSLGYISAVKSATIKLKTNAHRLFA